MRWFSMVMMVLGVVLAAAGAARNGEAHTQHRLAVMQVAEAERVEGAQREALAASLNTSPDALLAAAQSELQAHPLPAPTERLAQWWQAGGMTWALGMVLVLAGAGLMRRQHQQDVQSGGADGAADVGAMIDALTPMLDKLEQALVVLDMDQPPPQVDGESATQRIDRLLVEVIQPVVDRRGELMARHGSVAFVGYFSPLSSGERSLARTWSALTDGHAEEARASLADARAWFVEARSRWDEVADQ